MFHYLENYDIQKTCIDVKCVFHLSLQYHFEILSQIFSKSHLRYT
jgi:hypothetical protein